jgi:hypothetical protein
LSQVADALTSPALLHVRPEETIVNGNPPLSVAYSFARFGSYHRRPKADLYKVIDMLRSGPSNEIFAAVSKSDSTRIYSPQDEAALRMAAMNGDYAVPMIETQPEKTAP